VELEHQRTRALERQGIRTPVHQNTRALVKKLLTCLISSVLVVLIIFSTLPLSRPPAFLLFHSPALVLAEPDCNNPGPGDLDYCIQKIQQEIDALKPAHEYNKKELADLREQLDDLNKRIASLSYQLEIVEGNIAQREEDLAYAQEIFEEKTNNHYKFIRLYDPLLPFLSSNDASEAFREINFRQKAADEDRRTMEKYAQDLLALKQDKENLEKNKASLAAVQKEVDERIDFLAGEVEKVEAYIASLTAKQQQFIAQKLGSLNLPPTLGAGPLYCVDDRTLDPGFRPAFAFFTFGIPHRVGMNQYGAYGRAKSGQSYREMLQAYFEGIAFEKRPNIDIRVVGYGTMPLETYLLGIYEMPADWPIEALKAQAVAARSYALAYTNNGANEICTSQQCQVYKGGNKGGNWEAAVRATEGEVMVHSGQVITAWYASTSGGYTFTSADVGWSYRPWTKRLRDTDGDVGNFSDLSQKAYDKDSPCFYAAQGWRKEFASSAWLKSEEVADIVNVLLLAQADPSTNEHLYQTDKPNPAGTDTWDAGRVKQELRNRGITPYNSVSDISSSGVDWGTGRTTGVTVNGNAGTRTLDGSQFKDFLNLRAPANIQIVGPLYSVEKK
jgi:SpoIID/LytB domain protein